MLIIMLCFCLLSFLFRLTIFILGAFGRLRTGWWWIGVARFPLLLRPCSTSRRQNPRRKDHNNTFKTFRCQTQLINCISYIHLYILYNRYYHILSISLNLYIYLDIILHLQCLQCSTLPLQVPCASSLAEQRDSSSSLIWSWAFLIPCLATARVPFTSHILQLDRNRTTPKALQLHFYVYKMSTNFVVFNLDNHCNQCAFCLSLWPALLSCALPLASPQAVFSFLFVLPSIPWSHWWPCPKAFPYCSFMWLKILVKCLQWLFCRLSQCISFGFGVWGSFWQYIRC